MTPGARLGVYEIVALIGEGGMGSVYRARDTVLNRDVAFKVLPDAFASDADRLARFTREAQVLASLNHPSIAHIHGLEESGGVRALVMELVEGDDLSQRIARGAIPVDEALPIAKQIAERPTARDSARTADCCREEKQTRDFERRRLRLRSRQPGRKRSRLSSSSPGSDVYLQTKLAASFVLPMPL